MKKWADKSTEELKALHHNYMSLVFLVTTPIASQIREDVHEIEMELKRRQNFELAMQDAADEPLENLRAAADFYSQFFLAQPFYSWKLKGQEALNKYGFSFTLIRKNAISLHDLDGIRHFHNLREVYDFLRLRRPV